MDKELEIKIMKLQERISRVEKERDDWKGKSREHFQMASIVVASLSRQLADLQYMRKK